MAGHPTITELLQHLSVAAMQALDSEFAELDREGEDGLELLRGLAENLVPRPEIVFSLHDARNMAHANETHFNLLGRWWGKLEELFTEYAEAVEDGLQRVIRELSTPTFLITNVREMSEWARTTTSKPTPGRFAFTLEVRALVPVSTDYRTAVEDLWGTHLDEAWATDLELLEGESEEVEEYFEVINKKFSEWTAKDLEDARAEFDRQQGGLEASVWFAEFIESEWRQAYQRGGEYAPWRPIEAWATAEEFAEEMEHQLNAALTGFGLQEAYATVLGTKKSRDHIPDYGGNTPYNWKIHSFSRIDGEWDTVRMDTTGTQPRWQNLDKIGRIFGLTEDGWVLELSTKVFVRL